jgi:hypothetical protein
MRSGWNVGHGDAHDIDAWFYLGPMTEHAETDAGHFTLWRGNDDLITEGANYLSRPTRYHILWSALSLARNTAAFSPAGSAAPDLDGGELPPPTMVYDDGRQFGDVGAERLVKGESDTVRSRLATLSAQAYPVANRIVWYPEYAAYLGRIVDFSDKGAVAIATGMSCRFNAASSTSSRTFSLFAIASGCAISLASACCFMCANAPMCRACGSSKAPPKPAFSKGKATG